jgi:hypothetical protein
MWGALVVVVVFTVVVMAVVGTIALGLVVTGHPWSAYGVWCVGYAIPVALFGMALGLSEDVALAVGMVLAVAILGLGWFLGWRVLDGGLRSDGSPEWPRARRSVVLGVGSTLFSLAPVLGFASVPFAVAGLASGATGRGRASTEGSRRLFTFGMVGGGCALAVSLIFLLGIVALASDTQAS